MTSAGVASVHGSAATTARHACSTRSQRLSRSMA